MKLLLSFFLICITVNAESIANSTKNHIYEVGDRIIPFTLLDQHDRKFWIDNKTKLLIVTYDKGSTALQNRFLAKKGNTPYLEDQAALLIVDVSVIPFGIRSLFVLPKLKSFKHPLLLSYDENFSKMFPYKDEHIAIVKVEKRIVKEIFYCNNEKCLEEVFKK